MPATSRRVARNELDDVLTVQQELTAEISERLRTRLSLDDEEEPVSSAQPVPKHASSAS